MPVYTHIIHLCIVAGGHDFKLHNAQRTLATPQCSLNLLKASGSTSVLANSVYGHSMSQISETVYNAYYEFNLWGSTIQ